MVQSTAAFARWYISIIAVVLLGGSVSAQAQTGTIAGTLVDKANGEPIAGATIRVEGTKKGGYSDVKGTFTIKKVPAGVYSVVVRALGYNEVTIANVSVNPNDVTKLNVTAETDAVLKDAVIVEAEALKGADATLLRDRQKAAAVSDAIGSEAISRVAGASVADVATRVTGVSVVDGKYLTVRGLGDRYMNYQLNGAQMASSDPDRNDVSMDQFSASFVESVVTSKSFTPDQPGSFTGGSVNVKTKAFPSERIVSASMRVGYNTLGSLSSDFTAASTSPTDWLGFDNGTRAVPSYIDGLNGTIPGLGEARTDPEAAVVLDQASKSFSTPMAPSVGQSGLPARINMSYADIFDMGDIPFGVVASMQYATNFEAYSNGVFSQWQLTGKASEKDALEAQSTLSDRRGVSTVFWGAMFNLNMKPSPEHQVGVNFMHNQRGENEGRYLIGTLPRDLQDPNAVFETRTQRYIERGNTSIQLLGESLFTGLANAKVTWNASYNNSTQDEPDIRYFSNDFTPDGDSNLYFIDQAVYAGPQHFFRGMVEDRYWFDASASIPFESWTGTKGSIKVGGAYDSKIRNFTEQRYEYRAQNATYNGNPDDYFAQDNLGVVDTTGSGRPIFGNYIVDVTQAVNNYDGTQTIGAGFVMAELPVTTELRVITGVRIETTDLNVRSQDSAVAEGNVNERNILPSLSAVYAITERQNLRLAYGKTLARPTFRELAPFSSFDFVGGFIINGNPDLEQTNVDNFDLRWEWFLRPTDLVAVSGFYKIFENPIEQAIVSANNQLQFQNVPEALVYGIELEARTSLDFLSQATSNFYVGGNLTLTESRVDIPQKELQALIANFGEDVSRTRQLQGQSPYIFNVQLGYIDYEGGTDLNVTVNTFGDRLSRVSIGGSPNVFEKSRTRVDFVGQQRLFGNLSVKVQALNLLNPAVREFQSFKGVEYDMIRFLQGRTFTVGFEYKI